MSKPDRKCSKCGGTISGVSLKCKNPWCNGKWENN